MNFAEFFKNTIFCRTPANGRSSHRRYSVKKGVLKIFAILQENTCVEVSFEVSFVEVLKACNFIKKRLQHRNFPVKFAKFLRTSILKNISCGCFCLRQFLMPEKRLIKLSKPRRTQNVVKYWRWSFLRQSFWKYLFKVN